MLVELQFSIEDRHDGTILALLRGVVTLFEDIEVWGFVLTALYIGIIVVVAIGIVWFEIWICHT